MLSYLVFGLLTSLYFVYNTYITIALLESEATDMSHASYTNGSNIICSSGHTGIVNDDYCDCSDGVDEYLTSACSYILVGQKVFECDEAVTAAGNDNNILFTSRINDRVIDCIGGNQHHRDETSLDNIIKTRSYSYKHNVQLGSSYLRKSNRH